jgi:hypothetical protein
MEIYKSKISLETLTMVRVLVNMIEIEMIMGIRIRYPMGIYSIKVCIWVNILFVGLLLAKNLHPMGKHVLERNVLTRTR